MRVGKLTAEELNDCLTIINKSQKSFSKPNIGEDSALICGENEILITTDPITAECENKGELAVKVSANDVFASGGIPYAMTLTIIEPTNSNVENIKKIIFDASTTAEELGIEIVGGHTEFSDAVVRTVLSVTMLGRVHRFISSTNLKDGEEIIVTKNVAIEGSKIILDTYKEIKNLLTDEELESIKELEISIEKEFLTLKDSQISAMHDITEGGVLGALAEMCQGGNIGCIVYENRIPLLNATRKICKKLNINPYRLISSGSMIIVTKDGKEIIEKLNSAGISASIIGKICYGEPKIICENGNVELLTVKPDELFCINKGILS